MKPAVSEWDAVGWGLRKSAVARTQNDVYSGWI